MYIFMKSNDDRQSVSHININNILWESLSVLQSPQTHTWCLMSVNRQNSVWHGQDLEKIQVQPPYLPLLYCTLLIFHTLTDWLCWCRSFSRVNVIGVLCPTVFLCPGLAIENFKPGKELVKLIIRVVSSFFFRCCSNGYNYMTIRLIYSRAHFCPVWTCELPHIALIIFYYHKIKLRWCEMPIYVLYLLSNYKQ